MNNDNVMLTKSSEENEIKTYFRNVLELKQSGEEFPVNLDDVWMAVYSRKSDAVEALKREFIESEDFIFCSPEIRSKKGRGGHNKNDYFISVSCMEYFVARKVRPIFEVYRKIFHKVAEEKMLSPAEQLLHQTQILMQQAKLNVENEKRISAVENKVDAILEKQEEAEQELKLLPLSTEKVPEMTIRDKVRMLVNRYCNATGVGQQTMWDNVYNKLYYRYHISIKSYRKTKKESWLDVAEQRGFVDKIYDIISELVVEKGLAV